MSTATSHDCLNSKPAFRVTSDGTSPLDASYWSTRLLMPVMSAWPMSLRVRFTEAELDTTTLQQVQAAVRRIENGTFGQCLVDEARFDLKRLILSRGRHIAVRHQKPLEATSQPKPTL